MSSGSPIASVAAPAANVVAVVGGDIPFVVRRIYCVGRNYVEHIREMKEGDERDPPFFFQKPADALVNDGATIPYPPLTDDFHHEVELVVAIGRGGQSIPFENAEAHIFGYAIGIDLTRRDRQREARERGLPWEIGKSFDHSAPCGPIHRISSTGAISKGAIALSVNGAVRQKGDIDELIWNVPEIITNLSNHYELQPGDLIFTGTPAGVGPIVPGDRLESTIDGLGMLRIAIGPKKV
ncbi:MAG: fumarylacetoacetate hydrolase [Bradyrhizobium sp.]|jgi:fumarylpyruvate hydrolase|nr:fumarylacetoacetate hydrolase [Bradyrhizobium sp.]